MPTTVVPPAQFEFPDDLILRTATPDETDLSAVTDLIKPFGPVVACLAKAKWKATPLGDIGIAIPGIEAIPVGVSVCLGRACTDRLKEAVTTSIGSFLPAVIAALSAGGVAPVIAALGLGGIAGVAVGAGVTVGQVLAPAILVVAAQAAVVAGQLLAYDAFGAAPNGVCLTYPALPAVAAGVLNPVVGLVLLANTPVVVTPR
jgi:hypothetical protein